MPGLFANPFGSRSPETLPIAEPPAQNDRRRLSTVSMDEELDWHETVMFGPGEEPQRLRRASSFGDISAYANMAPQIPTVPTESTGERPTAFRYRSPSVVAARQQGLGFTRQRQGSVMGDRRGSVAGRRQSISDRQGGPPSARRPSLALGTESRGRQASVAWARQSSIIDRQLANMTWTQAESMMNLDKNFYDAIGDATQGRRVSLLGDKVQKMQDMQAEIKKIEIAQQDYPTITDPEDPRKELSKKSMRSQKFTLMTIILVLNAGCLLASIFGGGPAGRFVLVFILLTKSKDFLSVVLAMIYLPIQTVYHFIKPPPPVKPAWILTFIPAYSESEEQIIKAIRSLRNNQVEPHEQVMVVMLDGKARDVKAHMRILKSFRRPYVTFRWKRGEFLIDAGWVDDTPVIVFEKLKNAGKKDSLIMAFDLFNALRDNAPLYTRLLREEIWKKILPALTAGKSIPFEKFDMIFCTDADSTIYPGALRSLADALLREPRAIAACGSVLVETTSKNQYHFWQLYQQFQYCFGQFVRRRSESIWGKVTCLPGCVTMIRVRDEMKGAVRKYAEAITKTPVIHHQVQYLGTDRRLTYCMLSQNKNLRTIFVPGAVSLTEAPASLMHYLSQRRRWGSNSYFNDWFYCFGENMIIITRFEAMIEVIRLSMVYYRIANTLMFLYALGSARFSIVQLAPLLTVGLTPTFWFVMNVIVVRELRVRSPRIVLGFFLNHLCSPFLSMTIFYKVLRNLGSQVWGLTGGAAGVAASQAAAAASTTGGTEKTIEMVTTTKQVADRIALSAIAVPVDKNLSVVTEEDDGLGGKPPLAPPAPNIEAAATAKVDAPFGLNTSFSFDGNESGDVQENPFGDQAATNFGSMDFGGTNSGKSFSGASWKRRRSSAFAPTDRRRMSSVVSHSMLENPEEEDELDTAPGLSGQRASLPQRNRRNQSTSSALSTKSREKASIVSIPIVEIEEDADEDASEDLRKTPRHSFQYSPNNSRQASVVSMIEPEPTSVLPRRTSMSLNVPKWNSSFAMGMVQEQRAIPESSQGSPTAADFSQDSPTAANFSHSSPTTSNFPNGSPTTSYFSLESPTKSIFLQSNAPAANFPQRRISVSTKSDDKNLDVTTLPTIRRASVVRIGRGSEVTTASPANTSKPRQRSLPDAVFTGRRFSISTAIDTDGNSPTSPTLRRIPASPKIEKENSGTSWSFGASTDVNPTIRSPLRASFSAEDQDPLTTAGATPGRRASILPPNSRRGTTWSLNEILESVEHHAIPSPVEKEFT